MARETTQSLPLIKPGLTLRVTFEHGGAWREAFWFKYKKSGDIILRPSLEVGRTGHGKRSDTDPTTGRGIQWVRPDEMRDHLTLHPSSKDKASQSGPAVHGDGGVQSVGLDLRTLTTNAPLMVHHLARPDTYPLALAGKPSLHLGRAYEAGAPEIHFWAAPIDTAGKAAGTRLPPSKAGGSDFVFAPSRLTDGMVLIQVRLIHDPSKPHSPQHITSFPMLTPSKG